MVEGPFVTGKAPNGAPRSEAQELADRIHRARIAVISHDLGLREGTRAILAEGGFQNVRTAPDAEVTWLTLDVAIVDMSSGAHLESVAVAIEDTFAETGTCPLILGIESLSGDTAATLPHMTECFDVPLDPRAIIFALRSRLLLRDVLGESDWADVTDGLTSVESAREAREADVLRRIAKGAERRIDPSGMHVDRVAALSTLVGQALGMDNGRLRAFGTAAALHDLGTLVVPDAVLLKREALDAEEFALMRSHTWVGASILQGLEHDVTDLAARVAWCHHERWDGDGYPRGLSGEEIPLEARIVAAVDLFDALLHNRADDRAAEIAVTVLEEQKAGAFDPAVVDALVGLWRRGSASFLYVDPGSTH